ncbi:tail length tape measure protein [uncultured Mediterranean phage uvMED]|nr:tail length tape measure protein [uncultured Mediterranean phage uvMED]
MAAEKFIIEIRTKGFQGANKSLAEVTKSTRAFSREANKGSGFAATFRRNMSGLRNNLLLVSFAFGTAGLAFKKFVDASSGFEDVKTRLVGLMGSTERAERAFQNFNEVASTTPFSLQDVVEAGAQLKAFGADAEGMIKPVADLAAFMGTTATEAANSLGRAFAGGAGAADILRERGVLNLVKSFSKIDDLSKITLPEFRSALEATLVDPAAGIAGSTDRMSETFTGAFSNMTDSVTRLAARIGDILLPSLKAGVKGLGRFADAASDVVRRIVEDKANFDIFGESIEEFGVKIERLSVEQLNAELKSLQEQMEASKEPIVDASQAVISFGDNIKFLPPVQDQAADGVIKISENMDLLNIALSKGNGVTIGAIDAFDGLNKVEQDFNTTQIATNVNADTFLEKMQLINDQIKLRENNNSGLADAQKAFNEVLKNTSLAQIEQIQQIKEIVEKNKEHLGSSEEVAAVLALLDERYKKLTESKEKTKTTQEKFNDLLKQTDLSQIAHIESMQLLIEKNREQLGSTEEVAAVLEMLKEKYNDLTGTTDEFTETQSAFNDILSSTDMAQLKQIENLELLIATHQEELGTNEEVMAVLTTLKEKYDDLTGATKAAKQEAKDNAKAKKEEEDQLLKTAAATTTIASGLRTMMSAGASAEDQMKALVGTLAKLITMGVFSPGGVATGGDALMGSILGAFVGHTGGLIQNNGIQRFATGGMVQGQDNVPILAQSGEFIMQRSAVNSIGLQNLAQMNQTGEASGALTVNISGNIIGDEEHVRDKVLPAIKEELRREANA